MEEAIGKQISDYLIKPVNPNQILMAIKKILEGKRLVSETSSSSYQQKFREIGMELNQSLNLTEWKDLFKKLTYWEIQLELSDQNMTEVLNMQKEGVAITEITALSLYSRTDSLRALFLSVVILSLAGLPPLVGFFGKLFIFRSAVSEGLVLLALISGLASVIGAYYYLRIVYLIYFGFQNYLRNKDPYLLASLIFIFVSIFTPVPSGSFFTTYGATIFWLNFGLVLAFASKQSKSKYTQ